MRTLNNELRNYIKSKNLSRNVASNYVNDLLKKHHQSSFDFVTKKYSK